MLEKLVLTILGLQIKFCKAELQNPNRKSFNIGDLDLALIDDLNDTVDHHNVLLPKHFNWNEFKHLEKFQEAKNLLSKFPVL
jgi:hypothetical protein